MSDLLSFFAVVLDEEEEAFLDSSWELLDLLLDLVSVLHLLMVVELVWWGTSLAGIGGHSFSFINSRLICQD